MSRFQVGARVRIDDRTEARHHRVPAYVKGHCGEVVRVCRSQEYPETLAAGQLGGREVPVYRVRLRQDELWERYQGAPQDSLDIEIFEHWLEPQR